ncbi:hypothetical protein GCM10025768_22540 [Microbacterium pseudoresistens]|uniref:ABC-2 type transport system permease protein n=1 Tax=Microbacterium pseudoresistens TaxID=640634 RepID=A0A7Y9ETL5_9MICO|nr:hypothetical protein [Microbacterium pseudoresistens]NYD53551.1 ABC-2 type transport system permease protein [Microbacterium pseudoresistens]
MAALLLRLRWRQFGHQLGRSPWMIVSLALGGATALGMLALLAAGLTALRVADPSVAVTALVIVGTLIVTVWWVGSILTSTDDTMSPERFALLPVTARSLLPGLVLAGATTLGGMGTAIAVLLTLIGWSVNALALIAAVVLAPVVLAICVLGARVVGGLLARWLARRRMRDLVIILGVILLSSSGLVLNIAIGALQLSGDLGRDLAGVADVLGWTPMGAAFGVSASLAQGQPLDAVARLLIALVTVAGLWFIARALLAARLVAPVENRGGGRVHSAGVLDRMLPATAVGAVAARTLRYARRDPRQIVNIVMLLVLPGLLIGLTVMNGTRGGEALAPAVILIPAIDALLIGTILQMSTAYDNNALALHIHTGVSGRADRTGRLLGFALIAVPIVVILCVAVCLLVGRPDLLPASLGAAIGMGAVAAGAGSWVGAFLPGRAPAPEASPFGRGSSGGVQSMIAMAIMMPITLVVGGASFGFAIGALWAPWAGWVSLACGVILGTAAVWAGVVLGGRILDQRWPELLVEVSSES